MGRKKLNITDEIFGEELVREAEMYEAYLRNYIKNFDEDDYDDDAKVHSKKIAEKLLEFEEYDRKLMIILYLHYNKKIRKMYNELHLKGYIDINSLSNNISKLKNILKDYASN